MPLDPSVLLKVQYPQYPDPVEDYKGFLSLRQMMDLGKLRQVQLQQEQLQNQQMLRKAQYEQEDRQRAEAVRNLFAQNPDISFGDIAKFDPALAFKLSTDRRLMNKAKSEDEKTALELGQKRGQSLADLGTATLQLPEDQRQAYWDDAWGLPVDKPPTPQEVQAQIARSYGTKEQQAIANAAKEETRKQTEFDWKEASEPLQRQKLRAEANLAEARALGQEPIQPYQREQLKPKSIGDWIRIYNDPEMSVNQKATALHAIGQFTEYAKAGAIANAPNQVITNEGKLRDDYAKEAKNYIVIRDAFNNVKGAAKSQTGPGDISLVYAYMKLLDPGSTVREGEFATAQNAGGVPERVRAAWNKMLSGERLDPNVRKQFVSEAEQIHGRSKANYDKITDQYTNIAKRSGLDPRNVVLDYSPAEVPKATTGTVKMLAPNGQTKEVPEDQVSHYESLGAKRVK